MAQSFDEHKAAVLAANPTPPLTWYQHRDDPTHHHDDQAVAYVVMDSVDGASYRYEVYAQRSGGADRWHAVSVRDTEGPRSRPGHTTYATFPLLQAAVAASFETLNEDARRRIASELYARDLVDDLGIGFEPAPVADAATATLAGIATLPHWTLSPTFHRDTLAYALTASFDQFVPIATLGYAGQTLFWTHGHDAYVGTAPTIRLDSGENAITITVISADRQNVKTYTLTVTLA